jgi:hypothetical protein
VKNEGIHESLEEYDLLRNLAEQPSDFELLDRQFRLRRRRVWSVSVKKDEDVIHGNVD